MSRVLSSSPVAPLRASARLRRATWTVALGVVIGGAGAFVLAQTPSTAPATLTAALEDYVEMPRTAGANGGTQSARVNVLLEEPGGTRLFVAEHAGTLSIIDKATRRPVSYINFNGSADGPGLFPRFAPAGGFVSGLMGVAFDPDYRRNGMFYTIHLENPALTVDARPKTACCPGSTHRAPWSRRPFRCQRMVRPSRAKAC